MKKISFVFLLLFLVGCQELVEKPNDLISKSKMSEIIADMAINDQTTLVNPKGNMELGTQYILHKYGVKSEDFVASYDYYTLKKQSTAIINDAQQILKEKHPDAENYIDKKIKESQSPPEPQNNVNEMQNAPIELKKDFQRPKKILKERSPKPTIEKK